MSQDELPRLPNNGRPRRIHHHNKTFLDHRGNQAVMSWHNHSAEDPGLPQLWCWAFYFVNPKFSLDTFDGAQFKMGMFKDVAEAEFLFERMDFYLLPDATPEECVEHYRAELAKRGTVWEDLDRVQQAKDGKVQELRLKGLPGLVPAYTDDNDMTSSYKGAIVMSQDADWDPEHSGRRMCLVEFDPIPQHYYPDEKIYFNPMEHPVHPQWMDAMEVTTWIEDSRRSNCCNEFLETTNVNEEASSIGWSTW